jgi:NADH:ubiquinone oxidoreductase subunit 5 (subunit L)/multisubunit Na+/H+ antiporter MnhA subunit
MEHFVPKDGKYEIKADQKSSLEQFIREKLIENQNSKKGVTHKTKIGDQLHIMKNRGNKIKPIWNLLENKYYLDFFYFKFIIDPVKITFAKFVDSFNSNVLDRFVNGVGTTASKAGGIVYTNLDQRGIDKVLNLSSTGTDTIGSKVKLIQTGKTQQYLMYFLIGVIVISLIILLVL